MAELDSAIIRIVAEQLHENTDVLDVLVTAVGTGQSTWVFGDEEVLPTSAALQANLSLFEALAVPSMSISTLLAAVRAWSA